MVPPAERARRWLLMGLVALGLALTGAPHGALFHGVEELGATRHVPGCCAAHADTGPVVEHVHEHGHHDCTLCLFSGVSPQQPAERLGAPREARRAAPEAPQSCPRKSRRSPESERGPPGVV